MLFPCRPEPRHSVATVRTTWSLLLLIGFASVTAASGGQIEGTWESQVVLDLTESPWAVDGELTIAFEGVGWEVEGIAEVESSVWDRVKLEASIEANPFDLESSVTWDPRKRRFKKLTLDTEIAFREWEIGLDLDLYADHCWVDVGLEGEHGAYEVDVVARFGASKSFSLAFYRTDIEISFETCNASFDIESRFSAKKGFDRVDVEIAVPLPTIVPWLVVEAEIRLTRAGTQWSFEPEIDAEAIAWGPAASVEFFGEMIPSDGLAPDGLKFVGAAVEFAWGDAWSECRTSLAPAWNKKITGLKAYARAVGAGFERRDRCDRELAMELWAYSTEISAVASWDRVEMEFTAWPIESHEVGLEIVVEASSIAEIGLDATVEW